LPELKVVVRDSFNCSSRLTVRLELPNIARLLPGPVAGHGLAGGSSEQQRVDVLEPADGELVELVIDVRPGKKLSH
jgi:hypothetical protein